METQTRLSRHNKFISAENIIAIFSISLDDSLHAPSWLRVANVELYNVCVRLEVIQREFSVKDKRLRQHISCLNF